MESGEPHQSERAFLDEGQALDYVHYCLESSYNEKGIVMWWERPRTELDGRTPREAWEDERDRVIDLAESLAGQANH